VLAEGKALAKVALPREAIRGLSQDQATRVKEVLRVDNFLYKDVYLGMDLRTLPGSLTSPSTWRCSNDWSRKKN
jgi:hypothetical protein